MGRLLLAFAAGVAVASLTFVLTDRAVTNPDEQSTGVMLPSQSVAESIRDSASEVTLPSQSVVESIRDSASLEQDSGGGNRRPTEFSATTDALTAGFPVEFTRLVQGSVTKDGQRELLSGWTDDELRAFILRAEETMEPSQEMVEAEYVRNLLESELRDRKNIASWKDVGPPQLPIELPPEFGYLSGFTDNTHELLQRDPVDPIWSPQMEAQLQGFFASHPEITATFGYPIINCRTIGCEVAFVAYGLDGTEGAGDGMNEPSVARDFRRAAVIALGEQPWAGQLNIGGPSMRFHNGATTFLWHLFRE